MPNPTGKNSPSSFDEFTPTTPYGEKKNRTRLEKSAPVAGNGNQLLGSARRATEIALKSATDQQQAAAAAAQGQPPVIPPQQAPAQQVDPFTSIWQAAASQPGASDLVREYAAMQ